MLHLRFVTDFSIPQNRSKCGEIVGTRDADIQFDAFSEARPDWFRGEGYTELDTDRMLIVSQRQVTVHGTGHFQEPSDSC